MPFISYVFLVVNPRYYEYPETEFILPSKMAKHGISLFKMRLGPTHFYTVNISSTTVGSIRVCLVNMSVRLVYAATRGFPCVVGCNHEPNKW